MQKRNYRWFGLLVLVLLFALVGCQGKSKPTVMIVSSVASGTIVENQEFTIQAEAKDSKGITRIELDADGQVVFTADVNPPRASVVAPLTWKAASGTHTLSVRALNVDNVMSDPANVTVIVSAPAPVPTTAPTTAPTSAPPPAQCTHNAAFVDDVTVPDGTPWLPNQAFNKIWRMKNTGNCAWAGQTQFVFISGEAMTTVTAIAAPNTPPGSTADFSIPMTAPATLGRHQGNWQLRDERGALFGQSVDVIINVVSAVPPPQAAIVSPGNGFRLMAGQPVRVTFQGNGNTELTSVALFINGAQVAKETAQTATRQVTGNYGWVPVTGNYDLYAVAVDVLNQSSTSAHVSGSVQDSCQPSINFRADRTTINLNEHTMLRWDVDCVIAVYLDGQGVSGHDARDVAPTSTKTYTLRVNKYDGSYEERQVTITVNQPAPTPVPPPTSAPTPPPTPARRNVTGVWLAGEYSMSLTEALGCSLAECSVRGTLAHGTLSPQEVEGTINVYSGAIALRGVLLGSSVSFDGTVDASSTHITGQLAGVGTITFTKQ
jgi:hypothetical protein